MLPEATCDYSHTVRMHYPRANFLRDREPRIRERTLLHVSESVTVSDVSESVNAIRPYDKQIPKQPSLIQVVRFQLLSCYCPLPP